MHEKYCEAVSSSIVMKCNCGKIISSQCVSVNSLEEDIYDSWSVIILLLRKELVNKFR